MRWLRRNVWEICVAGGTTLTFCGLAFGINLWLGVSALGVALIVFGFWGAKRDND